MITKTVRELDWTISV